MPPSSSQNFVIKFRGSELDTTVVVSKAVAKRAVDRNRIRRITKEAFRKIGNLDKNMVVIVKNNIANLKMDQVKKELESLLLSSRT